MTEPRDPNFDPVDDRPGPARPISDQRARELVRGAIARLLMGEGEISQRPRPPVFGGRLLRVAVVVLGCLTAGAVAASLSGMRLWPVAGNPEPARDQFASPTFPAPEPEPAPPSAETPAPPVLDSQPARREIRPPARPPAPGVRQRPAARTATETATASAAQPTRDTSDEQEGVQQKAVARDALMLANRMRLERQWRDAAVAYQEIVVRFAGSETAYVALVARGQLLMDHLGKPAEALRLFRQALVARPDGPLTEEARYNIAVCYRLLGDVENEREALKLFLNAEQPNPRRAAAAARLAEIRR